MPWMPDILTNNAARIAAAIGLFVLNYILNMIFIFIAIPSAFNNQMSATYIHHVPNSGTSGTHTISVEPFTSGEFSSLDCSGSPVLPCSTVNDIGKHVPSAIQYWQMSHTLNPWSVYAPLLISLTYAASVVFLSFPLLRSRARVMADGVNGSTGLHLFFTATIVTEALLLSSVIYNAMQVQSVMDAFFCARQLCGLSPDVAYETNWFLSFGLYFVLMDMMVFMALGALGPFMNYALVNRSLSESQRKAIADTAESEACCVAGTVPSFIRLSAFGGCASAPDELEAAVEAADDKKSRYLQL